VNDCGLKSHFERHDQSVVVRLSTNRRRASLDCQNYSGDKTEPAQLDSEVVRAG
jgi:hypothetical protein